MSPIRAENRGRYPADWPAISRRIRERAGQRCEWCAAPNGTPVVRVKGSGLWARARHGTEPNPAAESAYLADMAGGWHDERGRALRWADVPPYEYADCRVTRVVLTVAHLDHTPENCADDNLAALCQRCHLGYDLATHVRNARETRERRSGQVVLALDGAA